MASSGVSGWVIRVKFGGVGGGGLVLGMFVSFLVSFWLKEGAPGVGVLWAQAAKVNRTVASMSIKIARFINLPLPKACPVFFYN